MWRAGWGWKRSTAHMFGHVQLVARSGPPQKLKHSPLCFFQRAKVFGSNEPPLSFSFVLWRGQVGSA